MAAHGQGSGGAKARPAHRRGAEKFLMQEFWPEFVQIPGCKRVGRDRLERMCASGGDIWEQMNGD
jgi:hypothetical protein